MRPPNTHRPLTAYRVCDAQDKRPQEVGPETGVARQQTATHCQPAVREVPGTGLTRRGALDFLSYM